MTLTRQRPRLGTMKVQVRELLGRRPSHTQGPFRLRWMTVPGRSGALRPSMEMIAWPGTW